MKITRPTPSSIGKRRLFVRGIESKQSTKQSDKVYVHCKICGFICNETRDTKCPFCESEQYNK